MAQINKPNEYFNTVTHTGDGTSPRTITGVNFQPDFTWIKRRDNSGANHIFYDSVRGAGSTKELSSNNTASEGSTAANAYGYLSAFASDGFTVTDGTSGAGNADLYTNASGATFVSWNWLASNTTASNTNGSIASTVSANTTSGFSIVSYTGNGTGGATVGHGLGQKPACIIVKRRSDTMNWGVYHQSLASDEILQLDVTNAVYAGSGVFNATQPTASVFYLGSGTAIDNDSGSTYIAYCFAEKKGFSKFGSYTGNNSSDGTFVYTGFKPAFILVKTTNTTQWWTLLDNKRDTYNVATLGISPNSSNTESTFNTDRGNPNMDFVSNGFKIRTDNSGINGTNSFIYMAFAENPLVGTNNIPATAR
jgi:hypothetical protein